MAADLVDRADLEEGAGLAEEVTQGAEFVEVQRSHHVLVLAEEHIHCDAALLGHEVGPQLHRRHRFVAQSLHARAPLQLKGPEVDGLVWEQRLLLRPLPTPHLEGHHRLETIRQSAQLVAACWG